MVVFNPYYFESVLFLPSKLFPVWWYSRSNLNFLIILLDVLSKKRHSLCVRKTQRNGLLWPKDLTRKPESKRDASRKALTCREGIFYAGIDGDSQRVNKASEHLCKSGLSYYISFFRLKSQVSCPNWQNGQWPQEQ